MGIKEDTELEYGYSTYRGLLHSRDTCATDSHVLFVTHLYGLPHDEEPCHETGSYYYKHGYKVYCGKMMYRIQLSIIEPGGKSWYWDKDRNAFIKGGVR